MFSAISRLQLRRPVYRGLTHPSPLAAVSTSAIELPAPKKISLRDPTYFPSFQQLPSDRSTTSPPPHWCFLSTVHVTSTLIRLRIDVDDSAGRRVPIYFHTPDRGEAFEKVIKAGNTVAVFYGRQHRFLDGDEGLRIDDDATVKVFPYTLAQLLAADKRICAAPSVDGCAQCGGKLNSTPTRCRKCQQVHYCSKKCRKANASAHSPSCGPFATVSWLTSKPWKSSGSPLHLHLPTTPPTAVKQPKATPGYYEDLTDLDKFLWTIQYIHMWHSPEARLRRWIWTMLGVSVVGMGAVKVIFFR